LNRIKILSEHFSGFDYILIFIHLSLCGPGVVLFSVTSMLTCKPRVSKKDVEKRDVIKM